MGYDAFTQLFLQSAARGSRSTVLASLEWALAIEKSMQGDSARGFEAESITATAVPAANAIEQQGRQMNRFIVILNYASGPTQDAITRRLIEFGWHVWHWGRDAWLLSGLPESETVESITKIVRSCGGEQCLVMKIDGPLKYSGYQPADAWPWLFEHWGLPQAAPRER